LIFNAAGTINLSGDIVNTSTLTNQFYSINKFGAGALNISSALSIIPTNNLAFFAGVTTFSGAGSLVNGNTIAATVFNGATLALDDSGTAKTDRLGKRNLTLTGGGIFQYTANTSTNSSETMGVLTLNTGQEMFNLVNGGSKAATLTFGSLSQGTGSSAEFNGPFGTGTNKIAFTTAPGLTNLMLPRIIITTGGGFDFATYNSNGVAANNNSNGLQAFTAYTLNNLDAAAATNTVKVTSNATIFGTRAINALAISGNGIVVTGVPGSILTIGASGGAGLLVTGGSNTLSIPVVNFGGNEGQIHINTGSTLT
jgi:hypothetical protein